MLDTKLNTLRQIIQRIIFENLILSYLFSYLIKQEEYASSLAFTN